MAFVSAKRTEKIEGGQTASHPDEALETERCYRNPELSNYYRTHKCPIGMKYETEAKLHERLRNAMELLPALGELEEEKNRLIASTADVQVERDERMDFEQILETPGRLETAIRAMRIRIEHARGAGKLEERHEL